MPVPTLSACFLHQLFGMNTPSEQLMKLSQTILVPLIPITLNSRLSISKRQPDALKTLQERF
ncbi:hypothetical protein C408_4512 [Vibrio diabolicus E0666]|nr:hypothetical protein C408_4512 [Vibrio diabolicus E0666]